MPGIIGRGLACRAFCSSQKWPSASVKHRKAGVPKSVAPGLHVLQLWRSLQCRHPSLSRIVLYSSGILGGLSRLLGLQTGQGAPAPPQRQASSLVLSPPHGLVSWSSQTQPVPPHTLHSVATTSVSLGIGGLGTSGLPCGAGAIFGDYATVGVSIISGCR